MSEVHTHVIQFDEYDIEVHVTQYKNYIETLAFQHENPNTSVFNWGYKSNEQEAHDLFQALDAEHELIQATVHNLLAEQEDEDEA